MFDKLWTLFITTFSISATTNGGYAIVAAMKDKFVEKKKWLCDDEMIDLMSLGQSLPGPIAVNTSVLVGYRIAGLPGALASLLGVIMPPFLIMTVVTYFYSAVMDNEYIRLFLKGMQSGVAALLVSISIDMFLKVSKGKELFNYVLMIFAFIFVEFTDLSVFWLALICAIAGIIKVKMVVKHA